MGSYTGTVVGTDAFVAVVAGKANVVVYVCDGKHHVRALFGGPRGAGSVALRDSRGARVAVTIGVRSASGAFTPAGESQGRHFAAVPARGPAGFYRAVARVRGARASIGWVVLNDRRQRGATIVGGRILAAPTLSTSTGTATLTGTGTVSAVRISSATVPGTAFNFNGGSSTFGG